MSRDPADLPRRSRRHVLIAGALALVVLYAVGAMVQLPRVERDLEDRVAAALRAGGVDATPTFDGQDGVLHCAAPLADPAAAVAVAEDVWGVRQAELAADCEGAPATSVPATTVPATTVPPTEPPTTSTEPPTTTTVAETTTTAAVAGLVTVGVPGDGRVVLSGTVATEGQRATLRNAMRVDPANLVDQLTVAAESGVPDQQVNLLAFLAGEMPRSLVTGTAAWDGTALTLVGVYADADGQARMQQVVADVGAVAALSERAVATISDAAALEAELNTLVAGTPILFDKGSATISAASQATIEKVAAIAKRFGGVAIEVQGHTDSEGDAGRNMTLSEQRAAAVVEALVAWGVPVADLTPKGYGETQLILDAGGNEVPEQSRRVVFAVNVVG